ncbi:MULTISPECIES: hypothetical protein [Marinobacter]|uniref:hypothetical protein n=1 Tax=Marinobacter TaxID=2742 RepID=UPI000D10F52C|nr:hypothetical protein [Marinobacter shengliensis]PSF14797.1 hypothetical protein C7H10_03675 [Marinobacter shengliensis]WBU40654.1 hypothetical protein PBN92_16370 [Marinobacter alkaliphilus]
MNEVIEMEKQNQGKTWAMARSRFGKGVAKVGVALSAATSSVVAFAADHSAAIDAAKEDGITNAGAAVAAVIALAAVVMGVGIVLRLMNR